MQRQLKNRHIQLIALGGAIGTGLFYGSSEAINHAGPSVLLAYLITGLVIFLVMRQMGEMLVDEPNSGSFSYFSTKYWGPFPGFLAGWNYWLSYIVVNMIELTVIGEYLKYWFPALPNWVSSSLIFVLITGINLCRVEIFGEMEFLLAMVKVCTILALIAAGFYLLSFDEGASFSQVSHLWDQGGFMPNGITGFLASIAVVVFAYGGTELIGVTAGEAEDPKRSIPKAVNQVMWRILIFYIGALAMIMILIPWNQLGSAVSPFVKIFESAHIPYAAGIMNFVLITAILSAYNSGLYANARMLYSLAGSGHAPAFLGRLNANGVPVSGILVSSFLVGLVVFLQAIFPIKAVFLGILSFSVACDTLSRIMITLTHMKFKKALSKPSLFPAPFYPLSSFLSLFFMFFVLMMILCLPSSVLDFYQYKLPILLSPLWVLFLYGVFRWKKAVCA